MTTIESKGRFFTKRIDWNRFAQRIESNRFESRIGMLYSPRLGQDATNTVTDTQTPVEIVHKYQSSCNSWSTKILLKVQPQVMTFYTVSQKKTRHQTLVHNFPKC